MLAQVPLAGRPSWLELREGDRTAFAAERMAVGRVVERFRGKGSFSGCEM